MMVEMTAFGPYFGDGLELIENQPFQLRDGVQLLVHLFDHRELRGRVLRADAMRALIEIGEVRWWLQRNSGGKVGHWLVHGPEHAGQHACSGRGA